jgi:hypothetical protein
MTAFAVGSLSVKWSTEDLAFAAKLLRGEMSGYGVVVAPHHRSKFI